MVAPTPNPTASWVGVSPWLHGRVKVTPLYSEITAQGFARSYPIVRTFVEQSRSKPDLTRTTSLLVWEPNSMS